MIKYLFEIINIYMCVCVRVSIYCIYPPSPTSAI